MKKKISICTGRFQKLYGPFRALEIAKMAGADAVDFTLTGFYDCLKPDNLYTQGDEAVIAHFAELKQHADSIGIEFAQTHGRLRAICKDPVKDEAFYKAARLDCIATRILGAKHCVVHTVSSNLVPPDTTPEEMHRLNFEMFTGILPYAKENGIKIATETFGNRGPAYTEMSFFGDADEFVKGYEAVASVEDFRDYFCYCVDTGHSNMAAHQPGQPSVPDLIRRLGPAVEVLHLNDNEGQTDMHAIPFIRSHPLTHAINWEDVFRALDEIGYQGYYNLELGWNTYGFNFSTEEAIFAVKVMKNLLSMYGGEPAEGFINDIQN